MYQERPGPLRCYTLLMLLIPAPESKDSTAQVLMFWWSLSLKSGRVRWFGWCFHCFPGEMCVGECSPRKIRGVSNPMVSVYKGGSSHLDDGWPWLVGFWSSQSSFSQKKLKKMVIIPWRCHGLSSCSPYVSCKVEADFFMLREFKDPGWSRHPCICLLDLVSKTMFDDKKKWQKSTIASWWSPHPGRLRCASVCETLGVATPGWSMWFPGGRWAKPPPRLWRSNSWKMVVEMLKTWKYEVITCNYMLFFPFIPFWKHCSLFLGITGRVQPYLGWSPMTNIFVQAIGTWNISICDAIGERAPSDLQVSHR